MNSKSHRPQSSQVYSKKLIKAKSCIKSSLCMEEEVINIVNYWWNSDCEKMPESRTVLQRPKSSYTTQRDRKYSELTCRLDQMYFDDHSLLDEKSGFHHLENQNPYQRRSLHSAHRLQTINNTDQRESKNLHLENNHVEFIQIENGKVINALPTEYIETHQSYFIQKLNEFLFKYKVNHAQIKMLNSKELGCTRINDFYFKVRLHPHSKSHLSDIIRIQTWFRLILGKQKVLLHRRKIKACQTFTKYWIRRQAIMNFKRIRQRKVCEFYKISDTLSDTLVNEWPSLKEK